MDRVDDLIEVLQCGRYKAARQALKKLASAPTGVLKCFVIDKGHEALARLLDQACFGILEMGIVVLKRIVEECPEDLEQGFVELVQIMENRYNDE